MADPQQLLSSLNKSLWDGGYYEYMRLNEITNWLCVDMMAQAAEEDHDR